MSSAPEGRVAALRETLAARGLRVDVEDHGGLAVLTPSADASVDWPAVRAEVVRIARQHGFSHVALELR